MQIFYSKSFKTLMVFAIVSVFIACEENNNKTEKAELWLTTLDQQSLLKRSEININSTEETEAHATINIDTSTTFQKIDGFGYTLTGGSAMHINAMSDNAKTDLIQELFGTSEGDLGVSYLRLSIGASDLDETTFSYNDLPEGETDESLERFSLAYDTLHLIPVLKKILEVSPDIKIMGSPWSPPTWMKDNNDTRGGSLKKEFYPAYANYFVKYIEAMAEEGITIDAITVQNEPLHPGNNPSLLMEAEDQADFVKNHLGPVFEQNGIATKIILYDHNADRPDYPISILDDPEAAKYIDGSAFHLYGGTIDALSQVHEAHPDKNIYFTEQWVGAPGDFSKEMTWHIENLIIGAPRNWSRNVLEWNLAADENQKPHTDRGGCDRCLGAITITGDDVTREPAYYIIGQASKFVRPGSVRVASNEPDNLPNVAFKTPEGKTAVIIQNKAEEERTVKVDLSGKEVLVTLPAGAVGTLVL
ncbi:glucosylceramidase [Antarcticibacterium flavum]|uniref:Glucosylceramidase n=1 Tax=Antarcticibacterium flavum TaxID=2058175 RepID=A0A5B7X8I7_9FLAO|nr:MULTISPECIES: glycoside hydrolase family 30 beta sandwich domain-containing protein [Antarcticibacterium]MCM4160878.1 glucosylceramidase [Antarcticibacterium sp. W02-3]QCY71102.1 glucosylceramidase [Antarcticibacterium flavum]